MILLYDYGYAVQSVLHTFTDHTDYVRAGLVSPSNPALVLTGPTIRLYVYGHPRGRLRDDHARGGEERRAWPVEDVLMFPAGRLQSALPSILRVWDLVAGGRCVRAMSNHQKTVTVLAFDGRAGRLLTGGLDQMVKVYDVGTYKVVHTMKYPALYCRSQISVSIHISALCGVRLATEPPSRQLMIPISQLASPMALYLFVDGPKSVRSPVGRSRARGSPREYI